MAELVHGAKEYSGRFPEQSESRYMDCTGHSKMKFQSIKHGSRRVYDYKVHVLYVGQWLLF